MTVSPCKLLSLGFLSWVLFISTSSHAVQLNPNGVGQVLIYPYYNAQIADEGTFNSLITITNQTAQGKALKVRIREASQGREVASFNLFLARRDGCCFAIASFRLTCLSAL